MNLKISLKIGGDNMNKVKITIALLICTLFTGCSVNNSKSQVDTADLADISSTMATNTDVVDVVMNSNTVSYKISDSKVSPTGTVVYDYTDSIPIIADGNVIAYANIQQFMKLGIWDWANDKAVRKNIKHSYAVNIKIRKSKDSTESFSVSCKPSFINKAGKVVGTYCKVGWSGFPEAADLYSADKAKSIELGVQPFSTNEKDMKLKLVFFDNTGTELNTAIISHNIFKSVIKGPSIASEKDSITIKSSNGGKYSIKLYDICRYYYKYENLDQPEVIDFKYKIKYLSTPTKKDVVSTFDPNNKLALNTNLTIGMQTDKCDDIAYNSITSNLHVDKYGYKEYYVTNGAPFVRVGKTTKYILNRPLYDVNSKYVRFIIEFPEEAKADSDKQLLHFNGRYRVVQCRIVKGGR